MSSTQKELAKLAGVSAGTVSNVISGSAAVSERTRQKVIEAIRVLNYKPNLIARSLRMNRTHTLGIVIPDITIPFFPKIIRGAESAAREHGYFLIVLDSEGICERETEMISLLQAQRVEGILLVTTGGQSREPEQSHALPGVPLIFLDRLPDLVNVDSVCVDDVGAAEMAISHLVDRGHKDIAVITGPLTLRNEQERLRGCRRALQSHGLPVRRSHLCSGGFEQKEVERLCHSLLLHSGKRPTALLATNGVTGLAALRSLYSLGLCTPRDLAFVTFDEITAEDFFQPSVTSIVQPTFDMGYRAVQVLLNRIAGETDPNLVERVRLPATLAVRDSSVTRVCAAADRHARS